MSEVKLANVSIYEKIENKGRQDAKKIIGTGTQKAKELETAILDEAKQQIAASQAKLAEKNAAILKTMATEFEQTAKQNSLARKKVLIDEAFSLAAKSLRSIPVNQWEKIVLKMLTTDALQGNETIIASKRDHALFLETFVSDSLSSPIVLDKLNKRLKDKKYNLTLSQRIATIDGGFLVEGVNFDIDHSHAAILAEIQNRYESEIATILFSGCE
ncbi:MAG: V-type ATP synthase subunit E family protein [Candidatus Izemoplasmatales bacterium]|jgi:vacuolar-type H+-ATPase subunit E/Vma4|nr:V-type ATP synthase subunit E family protein [Candidatus Izemoplasmatales bacterium]